MGVAGYEDIAVNRGLLLDLQFREGIGGAGLPTHDYAKPHHPITLRQHGVGVAPAWVNLANGLTVLDFDGVGGYLDCPQADTIDLNFMAGDYTIAGWFKWETVPGEDDQHIMGRYDVDVDGWELYLYEPTLSLNLRHHHAVGATLRTGAYSLNWPQGVWHFFGISRSGASAVHYRNGVAVTTTVSAGGLIDPETCAEDLTIGCRMCKTDEFFKGMKWRYRIWGRELSADDHATIYAMERALFGV